MTQHDLIIRNATIVDGSGAAGRPGDLAVRGDRIAALGDLRAARGAEEIDAAGLVLAPGFIDVHTHDDAAVLQGPAAMACKLSQGVTSVVTGNCGVSLAPARFAADPPAPLGLLGGPECWVFDHFADYAQRLAAAPPPTNVMALVGHMSLRVQAMQGDTQRGATAAEIAAMRRQLRESLDAGASGFSTGLWYPPNRHAPASEVEAIGVELAPFDGLYCSHMRDEGAHIADSIAETAGAGRAMPAPVVISHHKCMWPENHGRAAATLAQIDAAHERQRVDFDVYPYTAGSTALFPDVVRDDVPVTVTWSVPHPAMAGRKLADIAAEWGLSLRAAAERLLPAGATYFMIDEGDMRRILAHPRSMIGSDGIPGDRFPHPRLWGTFPRVLGHYSRTLKLMPLEQAIHKMTGRPAAVFGFTGRGSLRPGAFADLVLLDPATVADAATYEDPTRPAIGIRGVWVNGVAAYAADRTGTAGRVTGACAGRLVTRPRPGAAA